MNIDNSLNPDINILVCCHKQDFFISQNDFFPIHVGKELSNIDLGIQGDNTGDNISALNPNYCELTAHYWYWKNMPVAKYVGLNHYRRYFSFSKRLSKGIPYYNMSVSEINTSDATKLPDLDKIFKHYDIILAKPNVYPYSLGVDYSVSHSQNDIIKLGKIIDDLYPEYATSFNTVIFSNNKLAHYNMFIMKGQMFKHYSEWLFSILAEAQKRIPAPSDPVQGRIYGYMAERLLNVYAYHHRLKIKYTPVIKVCDEPNATSFAQKFRAILQMYRNNIAAWLTRPRLKPQ